MKFPRISIFEAILGFCFRCRVKDFGYIGQSYGVASSTPVVARFVF